MLKENKADIRTIPEFKFVKYAEVRENLKSSEFLIYLSKIQNAPEISNEFKEFANKILDDFFEGKISDKQASLIVKVYEGYKNAPEEEKKESNSAPEFGYEGFEGMMDSIKETVTAWSTLDTPAKISHLIKLIDRADRFHLDESLKRLSYILYQTLNTGEDCFLDVISKK